jgi:hypothetical protein
MTSPRISNDAAKRQGGIVMANQVEGRRNPGTEAKQPIGGGNISRDEDKGGRSGGLGNVSQQSNADADGPSRQTSTAQDEKGQL